MLDSVAAEAVRARIQELKQERQQLSIRANQLQDELNKTAIHVHQLDGGITALEEWVGPPTPQ